MNTKFALAAVILSGLAMTSCQKEEIGNGLPENAIMLTTEGFHSDNNTKTSTSGTSVQWVGGESVLIGNSTFTVLVAGGKAYVNGGDIPSGTIYGYYGYTNVKNNGSDTPTISVSDEYNCSYDGNGRQVIALPMVAYSATKGETIRFQHITAAINVKVKNEISDATLVLDRVTVNSTAYKLWGDVKITHAVSPATAPTVPTQSGSGTVTVNFTDDPTIAYNAVREVQVPILPIGNSGKITVTVYTHDPATSNEYTFSKEVDAVTLARNAMLTAGCRISTETGNVDMSHVVDLSDLTSSYEAKDGEVLTGTLQTGTYPSIKITIASGATVTLRDVVIDGSLSVSDWAGITCENNATIVLEGENSVTGFGTGSGGDNWPGIYIASGKTLTIRGDGSLTATGAAYGAGIGGGYEIDCGNIVIESGSINAVGDFGAGIGGGYGASCGNITISGGTINATAAYGAGIGSCEGDEYGESSCGNILITGGAVTATGGDGAAAIGSGTGSSYDDEPPTSGHTSCGNITISGTATCPLLTTTGDYTVGPGTDGLCGTVTIKGTPYSPGYTVGKIN